MVPRSGGGAAEIRTTVEGVGEGAMEYVCSSGHSALIVYAKGVRCVSIDQSNLGQLPTLEDGTSGSSDFAYALFHQQTKLALHWHWNFTVYVCTHISVNQIIPRSSADTFRSRHISQDSHVSTSYLEL